MTAAQGELETVTQWRAKDVLSFTKKALRKGYADPLKEIGDKAGTRVIVHISPTWMRKWRIDAQFRASGVREKGADLQSLSKMASPGPEPGTPRFSGVLKAFVVARLSRRFACICAGFAQAPGRAISARFGRACLQDVCSPGRQALGRARSTAECSDSRIEYQGVVLDVLPKAVCVAPRKP